MQLYCVRCKRKVEVAKPVSGLSGNGRSMVSGPCPKCNTACNQFVKSGTVAGLASAPKRRSSRKRKSARKKS